MIALATRIALARDPAIGPEPPPLAPQLAGMGLTVGAYLHALGEVERLPPESRWPAWMEAGDLLLGGGEDDLAAQHFLSSPDPDARLAAGWALYRAARYAEAARQLDVGTAEARWLQGWAELAVGDEAGARAAWVAVDGPLAPRARGALAELTGRRPHRSPAAAGVLSAVLPGAGQAYAGRWTEALSALLVNGAFIAGGVEFARHDLWTGVAVLALFEAGFYGGNVLSAVNGARRFDRLAIRDRHRAAEATGAPAVHIDGAHVTVE